MSDCIQLNCCILDYVTVSDGLELRPKYSGILHCMRSVWHQEGLRGLYQGVTPNIWGAGASWGLYFFLYVFFFLYSVQYIEVYNIHAFI